MAELEIWHSRAIAPTRRVAVGKRLLPVDPPPGFGGLLLGGVVAAHMEGLDPELSHDLSGLISDLEKGRRIPQPRLRHRFQDDHHGLARSRHRLAGDGDELAFDFDDHGSAASQILGAVYAAGRVDEVHRSTVMETIRRALRWQGTVGPELIRHLAGVRGARSWSASAFADPVHWALGVLGFTNGHVPDRTLVRRRFREQLRDVHPDHGAASEGAAQRIGELSEARRILLQ